jgi:hypothetical protein
MATSPYDDTKSVLDFMGRLFWEKEVSVLDVGAGFGRWGFLLRCHLGFGRSLTTQKPQRLSIDAIEAFRGNISPIHHSTWNGCDFEKYEPFIKTFDRNGLVIITKSEEARWQTRMMSSPLRRLAFKTRRALQGGKR